MSTRAETTDVTRASSGSFLDRGEHDEWWGSTHGKSYRVADGKRLGNLFGHHAEPHRHARHVAGNVLMGEDDDAEVRQDRPDDAVDPLPLALGPAPRERLCGGRARRLRASPRREGSHADEDEERVDDDDRFPGPHFTAHLT